MEHDRVLVGQHEVAYGLAECEKSLAGRRIGPGSERSLQKLDAACPIRRFLAVDFTH